MVEDVGLIELKKSKESSEKVVLLMIYDKIVTKGQSKGIKENLRNLMGVVIYCLYP